MSYLVRPLRIAEVILFMIKKFLKVLLIACILLVLVVLVYVAYVFLSYSRIEDNLSLSVEGNADETVQINTEYGIISYNAGFGAYTADFTFFMDEGKESRARSKESVEYCINSITDTTLAMSPDIVLFQELDTDADRSWHVNEPEIVKSLFAEQGTYDAVFAQNYHSAYLMYPLYEPHGASEAGILTLSRFDVTSALRRSLPIATNVKKFLDLDRCYSISRIPVQNGKELIVINTHLSAYGTDAQQGNQQLEMLFADMKAEYDKGNYVICGGDFNHDFTGDSKEYFNSGTDKTYSWCHPFPAEVIPEGFSRCIDYTEGMTATSRYTNEPYNENSFVVILDGFIVSDNVDCTYVQNIDTGYQCTDHNPVLMKFLLKD